jgi:hypothetical protein
MISEIIRWETGVIGLFSQTRVSFSLRLTIEITMCNFILWKKGSTLRVEILGRQYGMTTKGDKIYYFSICMSFSIKSRPGDLWITLWSFTAVNCNSKSASWVKTYSNLGKFQTLSKNRFSPFFASMGESGCSLWLQGTFWQVRASTGANPTKNWRSWPLLKWSSQKNTNCLPFKRLMKRGPL